MYDSFTVPIIQINAHSSINFLTRTYKQIVKQQFMIRYPFFEALEKLILNGAI
jgi:hypothetical protein